MAIRWGQKPFPLSWSSFVNAEQEPSLFRGFQGHFLPFSPFLQRLKDEIAEVTNEIENLGSTEER